MSDIAGGGIGTPYTLTLYEDELADVIGAIKARVEAIDVALRSNAIEPNASTHDFLVEARVTLLSILDRTESLYRRAIGRP